MKENTITNDIPHWYMFPTKSNFKSTNSSKLFEQSLSKNHSPLNLYVHIPFCNTKCGFCDLHTVSSKSKGRIDSYISSLSKEIFLLSKNLDSSSRELVNIYVGGGTPSVLMEDQVSKLFDGFSDVFNLESVLSSSVEFSPDTVNNKSITPWHNHKFNRASIGIQSFNENFSCQMNRNHTHDESTKAVKLLSDSGFQTVNVDLIYGYENQEPDDLIKDIDIAIKCGATSLTLHPLAIRKKTAFEKKYLQSETLSEMVSRLQSIYKYAIEHLEDNNFIPTSAVNFTLDGTRNELEYSEAKGTSTLGIGSGARSHFPNYHAASDIYDTTSRSLDVYVRYMESLSDGRIPIMSECIVSPENEMRRSIVLGLMQGALIDNFWKKSDCDNLKLELERKINKLIKQEFVIKRNNILCLTKLGILNAGYVGRIISTSDNILGDMKK